MNIFFKLLNHSPRFEQTRVGDFFVFRVCLNFVFRVKNDQFFVLLERVFEGGQHPMDVEPAQGMQAIAEETGFINAEKGLF